MDHLEQRLVERYFSFLDLVRISQILLHIQVAGHRYGVLLDRVKSGWKAESCAFLAVNCHILQLFQAKHTASKNRHNHYSYRPCSSTS